VTPEINDLSVRAAQAVCGGILAVDLVEHPIKGLLVNEINHSMEFHTTVPFTGVDLPNMVLNYLLVSANRNGNMQPQYVHNPLVTSKPPEKLHSFANHQF